MEIADSSLPLSRAQVALLLLEQVLTAPLHPMEAPASRDSSGHPSHPMTARKSVDHAAWLCGVRAPSWAQRRRALGP